MEDYYIKKFLEILNINSVNKLNEGSIDYFWQKKYKDIQTSKNISNKKKENLLIELNNAKDGLNKGGRGNNFFTSLLNSLGSVPWYIWIMGAAIKLIYRYLQNS